MPQPNVQAAQVRGPLANVSIAYRNQKYIHYKAFPVIPNVTAKSKILTYPKGAWFRDEAGTRGQKGRFPRGGYPIGEVNIDPSEYGFAKEVTDKDRNIAKQAGSPPLRLDTNAIKFASDKVDLKKERACSNLVLTGTWSGVAGEDAEGKWAAGSGNTFIEDVETRKETIRKNTGFDANGMIIDAGTYRSVKRESTVLDRLKITDLKVVTADLLAGLFELDWVIIAGSIYSTAKEKKDGTDFTAVNIWEKNAGKGSAFLYYAPPEAGLEIPSAVYQCNEPYEDGQMRHSKIYREEAEGQDVYEVSEQYDVVIAGADLGFLWYDTLLT